MKYEYRVKTNVSDGEIRAALDAAKNNGFEHYFSTVHVHPSGYAHHTLYFRKPLRTTEATYDKHEQSV